MAEEMARSSRPFGRRRARAGREERKAAPEREEEVRALPEEKREEFRGEGEKAARGRSRLMDAILECRPFMLFPEETRVHLLESQKETLLAIRGFIDAAISEENIRHMVEARRELGLAVRSIVDEAIENIEEQERKETEGPTKVPVE